MNETGFREVSAQEGYALWAACYDQEHNGLIFVEERQVDRLLAPLSFTKVLDVGTGTGRHALKLARRGASVTARLQHGGYLLITDSHPVHTIYGWKTAFRRAGVTYHLPTVGHTRDDYLEAITASGLAILEVTESLVGEVPEGYLPEEMRRTYADKPFCLSILAQKNKE